MKKLLEYYAFLLIIFAPLLFFSGCSPVKRVLQSPEKFAQVRDSVFARGLCLNDTIVKSITRDSLVYKYTTIVRQILVRTPAVCRIDTVVNGTRVLLQDGVLVVKSKVVYQDRWRTVTKTNTVRDKSRETVLQKLSDKARKSQLESERQAALLGERLKTKNYQLLLLLLALLAVLIISLRKVLGSVVRWVLELIT